MKKISLLALATLGLVGCHAHKAVLSQGTLTGIESVQVHGNVEEAEHKAARRGALIGDIGSGDDSAGGYAATEAVSITIAREAAKKKAEEAVIPAYKMSFTDANGQSDYLIMKSPNGLKVGDKVTITEHEGLDPHIIDNASMEIYYPPTTTTTPASK